jgi:hypothetical protein
MPRGITHVPENRSPSSDCRIPPLSGPHGFNSVVGSRARSIARPRLISPSGQPCSVCAGSVPIEERRRLTRRIAGAGRARRVSTVTATRCSHPRPHGQGTRLPHRTTSEERSWCDAKTMHGPPDPPYPGESSSMHMKIGRPKPLKSHRVTHVSTQTTRGTLCLC